MWETQFSPTLCNPLDCSMLGFPVLYQLPEFAQTHVHWVDAIQVSHPLLSPSPPALSLSQHQYFPVSPLFASGGQSIGALAPALAMNIQSWFPLGLTGLFSLLSKDFQKSFAAQEFASVAQLKASVLQCSVFFMYKLSHLYMTTGKAIALNICTFVDKEMSLLFNMSSRFVMTFLPRRKCLLISWWQSLSALILETKKIKPVTIFIAFSFIHHEVMGPDAMILIFWMLSFEPAFTLSSFTLKKRLFNLFFTFCHKSGFTAYLRLLILTPETLIPACNSSMLASHMMYSTYKLDKQDDTIQPWQTHFPVWNPSILLCLVLTVASWPAYRFLWRQIRCSGILISLRICHSLLWSTQSKALV